MFSPHAHRVSIDQSELIRTLIAYHDSGAYQRDIATVARQAKAHVEDLPDDDGPRALVLDIDETSLANRWSDLVDPESGYDKDAWDAWIQAAEAPPIEPTLALFDAARRRGIDVFFITGRTPDERSVTEANLRRAGYEGWTELILEPMRSDGEGSMLVFPEAAAYKTAARWSISQRGYRIVLSMGDQLSDLEGGYADRTFRLPNPFYTII